MCSGESSRGLLDKVGDRRLFSLFSVPLGVSLSVHGSQSSKFHEWTIFLKMKKEYGGPVECPEQVKGI